MDAITFLKQDHKSVEELFRRFEAGGARSPRQKRKLVDQMIEALSRHASIEEQYMYPAARRALSEDDCDIVLEALEEHHVVKWILNELINLSPEAERFDAKVSVLIEAVRHHVKEEEGDLFPKLRKAIEPAQLKSLGTKLERARATAPTRPHPRSPDTPPGNFMVSPMALAMDRGRELLKSLTSRARTRRGGQPGSRVLH